MPAQLLSLVKSFSLIATFIFFSAFATLCATSTIIAGSGLVSSIGGVTFVQGTKQFWHSSAKPSIGGVTAAGTSISGTVGSETVAATADSAGNWSWTPATDLAGDNQVALTSGSQSVTFILTIGAVPASIASASGSTLAPAGSVSPTIMMLGLGIILTTVGFLKFRRSL